MPFITFGEIMLRLTPKLHANKINHAKTFDVNFAGSESNVASSLAVLANNVDFVTKLPENQLGDAAISALQSYGVSTKFIKRGGHRIGSYFIEIGSSIRPSSVIYDRKNSAISEINSNEFDWEYILKNKKWLFVSGITPALSKSCVEETIKLVKTAKQMGVLVSFDMNFRRTLWDDKKRAQKIFSDILEHTDLLFGNYGVLKDVYDINQANEGSVESTIESMALAKRKFGLPMLAFTTRDHESATINKVGGVWLSNSNPVISTSYTVSVLDRFGTGDAFAAACLHGMNQAWQDQKIIDFATAAFALKHTIYGDQHTSSEKEIEAIMNGNIKGHVIR